MENLIFIAIIGIVFMGIAVWGIIFLPGEKWQMMAAIPEKKNPDNSWISTPVTFYGFFSGLAYSLAAGIYLILSLSVFENYKTVFMTGVPVLFACIPASKIIALIVEKKKHTFTIGGASFFGFATAPLWFFIVSKTFGDFSVKGGLSAIIIAYAFGEGLGRLACISFGCCYGKPVEELHRPFRIFFKKFNFKFTGLTKKACYESSLESRPLIPIQGITAFLYIFTGLVSLFFFFRGNYSLSFFIPLFITQSWRVFSETLRCDFRGEHKRFSAYQIMALSTIPYGFALCIIFSDSGSIPDLAKGISMFWTPENILFLQGLFLFTFRFTGRSEVTKAHVKFEVIKEKI